MSKNYMSALLMDNQNGDSNNFVISYGIACARKNSSTGNYEILMIKKRATYAFIDFLRGRYDPMRFHELEFAFNEMTISEKILIRTRDFNMLWVYCWGSEPVKPSERNMYAKSAKKFMQLCEIKDGEYLLDLLNKSGHAELLWEIPKGRLNKNESPIDSAMREFEEETGIGKESYRLLPDEGTIEYTFSDAGVRYKYIYYLAIINRAQVLKYDFSNEHMLVEVGDIKFLPAIAVQQFNNNRLYQTIRIIIKKLKKYF